MPSEEGRVLAQVAQRMLERDDEDLAIDQLPAPGRADDPDLSHTPAGKPLQEHAAERAEPEAVAPSPRPLDELRQRIQHLQAQLAALPKDLDKLDELERRAVDLTERRDHLRDALARLPEPKTRLLGRVDDPHLVDRTRFSSALEAAERSLERTLTERATLARQLGDPETIRDERDGLRGALQQARREHERTLDGLVERELADRPAWTREVLGERPDHGYDSERWDRAAAKLARYRITYDISDTSDPLGPEPPGGEQRHDYQRALQTREELAHRLERETPGHDTDLGR
jgi:hypothetical protein